MNRNELLIKIRTAGVIGAGGAGFPTYKKLDTKADTIIANGAECEPLLHKDRASMLREMELLFAGLKIMKHITGAEKVFIAIKEKNKEIALKYENDARKKGFEFFIYGDVYPAGDEVVLIYEITGRRVPPGGLPFQIGCVVDNTETIINVAKAVADIPVTEKYVTINGEVKLPMTVSIPVGASINDCIELAGGATTHNPAVIIGGVMMGKLENNLSRPINKTEGGIIVLDNEHYLIRHYKTKSETYQRVGHGQCDQCSQCTELCPRYILGYPIEPHKVMRNLLFTGKQKDRDSLWAQYCVECNVCTLIACPEGLDPKNICVDAKQLLKERGLSRNDDELKAIFRDVHPFRSAREVPIETVYRRLGLSAYQKKIAEFKNIETPVSKIIIPLDSHIGVNANPTVKIGETVRKGQLIGNIPENELGCPVHASIDGVVEKIDQLGIHIIH
jgi:Na+-translocating ferredoxin:NAD+ oxidoreductase RnfC subunit